MMLVGRGPHLMSRPPSNNLRERVVAAVIAGESCHTVACGLKTYLKRAS